MPSLNTSKVKRELGWILSLILVLSVMVMIYGFSAQNADDSSKTSGAVVEVVIDVTVPKYDELPVEEQVKVEEKTSHIVRKLAHFTEFAMLGFSLCMHLSFVRARIKTKNEDANRDKQLISVYWLPALSLLIGALYACSDEYHQSFTDGRGPGVLDVLIDSSGVLCGALVMFVILLLLMHKKLNKK